MTFNRAIQQSSDRQLVPPDKFDRHMRKARLDDIEARRNIFVRQVELSTERKQARAEILSSTY